MPVCFYLELSPVKVLLQVNEFFQKNNLSQEKGGWEDEEGDYLCDCSTSFIN